MFASLNGEGHLTQSQKTGLADSIQKGGLLSSAFENIDDYPQSEKSTPTFSLQVHSEAQFLLAGTRSGAINLFTIRHEEGKIAHVLKGHSSPVSVLLLTQQEEHVVSGSWDKSIKFWDLNTGAVLSQFADAKTQITCLSFNPTNESILLANSFDGNCLFYDIRSSTPLIKTIKSATLGSSPWCISSCWNKTGDLVYVGRRNATGQLF